MKTTIHTGCNADCTVGRASHYEAGAPVSALFDGTEGWAHTIHTGNMLTFDTHREKSINRRVELLLHAPFGHLDAATLLASEDATDREVGVRTFRFMAERDAR